MEMYLLQKFPTKEVESNKIITLSLAFFIFFILAILNSLISTDLIIRERPFVIDTLEDILDPRASNYKPLWRKEGLHYTTFSRSNSPIRQKVWQRALKIGLERCLIADDYEEFFNDIAYFSKSPSVFFTFKPLAELIMKNACFHPTFAEGPNRAHIGKEVVSKELVRMSLNLENDSCKSYKRSMVDKRLVDPD